MNGFSQNALDYRRQQSGNSHVLPARSGLASVAGATCATPDRGQYDDDEEEAHSHKLEATDG